MSAAEANEKIRMLRGSLRCFTFGLLSFVPVAGFGFAIAALGASIQAAARERRFWNAARPYRLVGMIAAIVGTIFWTIISILVIWNVVYPPQKELM